MVVYLKPRTGCPWPRNKVKIGMSKNNNANFILYHNTFTLSVKPLWTKWKSKMGPKYPIWSLLSKYRGAILRKVGVLPKQGFYFYPLKLTLRMGKEN